MSSKNKEEYMRLLPILRDTHNVHDEDALLDRLDDLWFSMTDEERGEVEVELSKSKEGR